LALICDLLHRFFYLKYSDLTIYLEEVASQIVTSWGCKPENTIIVSVNKSKYADSSEAMLWYLKSRFAKYSGWHTAHFFTKMGDAVEAASSSANIILVDEFIGSGETIRKAAQWIEKRLSDKGKVCDIKICSIAAMVRATLELDKVGKEHFSCVWLKRGISDHYDDDKIGWAVTTMTALEAKLCYESDGGRLKQLEFGYKRCEALHHLEGGNTPNNVFPLFWWRWLKGRVPRETILGRP
jgi:hypothetical protein